MTFAHNRSGKPATRAVLTILACVTLALGAGACSSPSPASDTAGSTPAATTSMAAPSTEAAASPTQPPKPTPIPTLPTTSEDATEAPSGAISIQMKLESGPRFTPDQVTATAGTVVFFLQNMRPSLFMAQEHNLAIGTEIGKVLARSPFVRVDKAAVLTVEGMKPGTYTFWCEVGVHAAEGMVGTLTITP